MKVTKRQKQIISLMREGWTFFIGENEDTGRSYFGVTKGMDSVYFNGTVFSNLILKELIYQQNSQPFEYVLTNTGKTIKL